MDHKVDLVAKESAEFLFSQKEKDFIDKYIANPKTKIKCHFCTGSTWVAKSVTVSNLSEDTYYKMFCEKCGGVMHVEVLKTLEYDSRGWPKLESPVDKNKLDTRKLMAGILEDFLPALAEVADLGSMNNKPNGKYDRGSWMLVEGAEQRYLDAFWRHIIAGRYNIDHETGKPHDVAIAWNALALLWFRLKREGKV